MLGFDEFGQFQPFLEGNEVHGAFVEPQSLEFLVRDVDYDIYEGISYSVDYSLAVFHHLLPDLKGAP